MTWLGLIIPYGCARIGQSGSCERLQARAVTQTSHSRYMNAIIGTIRAAVRSTMWEAIAPRWWNGLQGRRSIVMQAPVSSSHNQRGHTAEDQSSCFLIRRRSGNLAVVFGNRAAGLFGCGVERLAAQPSVEAESNPPGGLCHDHESRWQNVP